MPAISCAPEFNCAHSARGMSDRLSCLSAYLGGWRRLADKHHELTGLVRDLLLCARHDFTRTELTTVSGTSNEAAFSCKRPMCPRCYALKVEDTLARQKKLCRNPLETEVSVVGGTLVSPAVSLDRLDVAVEAALGTWGKVLRTKIFRNRVETWSRAIAVRRAEDAQGFQINLNLVLRLRPGVSPDGPEAHFFAIAGLMSRQGWTPTQLVRFGQAPPKEAAPLAASGFSPGNFCCREEGALRAEPEILWPLHSALHGRRLVAFGQVGP